MSPLDEEQQRRLEAEMATVRGAAVRLTETFDAVQILVTRLNPDGSTTTIQHGAGNQAARFGMMVEQVVREQARMAEEMRRGGRPV